MATEYFLCIGNDHQTLVNNVNAAIKNGWQPIGGVAIIVVPPGMPYSESVGMISFCQAVIR